MQAAEMQFLRGIAGLSRLTGVPILEIREILCVEPLLLHLGGHSFIFMGM